MIKFEDIECDRFSLTISFLVDGNTLKSISYYDYEFQEFVCKNTSYLNEFLTKDYCDDAGEHMSFSFGDWNVFCPEKEFQKMVRDFYISKETARVYEDCGHTILLKTKVILTKDGFIEDKESLIELQIEKHKDEGNKLTLFGLFLCGKEIKVDFEILKKIEKQVSEWTNV